MENGKLKEYFNKIEEFYESPENRESINKGLENILKRLGAKKERQEFKEKFDGEKARKIRVSAGISMKDLSKKLTGTGYDLYEPICAAEKERVYPSTKSYAKSRKYLLWLAKQGYDPYGILNED